MRRSILLLVLALGSSFAAARNAGAQEVHVALGNRHGFHAELGFGGRSYARVGYRSGYGYRTVQRRDTWIPGGTVETRSRVWIPGGTERIWREPVYEYRSDGCGDTVRLLVRSGTWERISHPGRYEWRPVRTWRPGHWAGHRYR